MDDIVFDALKISENELKIVCSIIELKVDIENLLKGKYLKVIVDGIQPIYIKYEEFNEKYKLTSAIKSVPYLTTSEESISNEVKETTEAKINSPDYGDLLTFILSKINNHNKQLIKDNLTVIIISDLSIILELPWEKVNNSAIFFRKYKTERTITERFENSNNLVILMSHAHEGIGHDLKQEMDHEIGSIYDALHILRENNQQSFRINKILLSKHTTKKTISEIDWQSYNFLHLICHGDSNGDLVFEKDDNVYYRDPDIMTKEEFVNILNKQTFRLIFLSLCNSGGGITIKESIAYQLIKNEITNCCIAYRGGIGEKSASNFTSNFYERMLQGNSIQETYKESLLLYKRVNPTMKYLPYIYIS